jgi:2-polyprenyl-6-methoxyphenol hydroxylase-like FAD-dependent oxidoreductase
MISSYDAIVIGARCAGAPVSMLLAQRGLKVLTVDRATFPSDTISTHLIHPPGMAALERWGLADEVTATNCSPIDTYVFDFGPVAISGNPGTAAQPTAYSPRRTLLDESLVHAAANAGADVREGFTVEQVVIENGRVTGIRGHDRQGTKSTASASVVIGADGRHSILARTVEPEQYNEKPVLESSYYTYYSNLPMKGRMETYVRGDRAFAAWPTNDDLTLVVGGWPIAQFESNKRDVEGSFLSMFDRVPEFAERIRAAKREDRLYGAAVPGYFRKPFGPGWALVGDAGYNKDFMTAQGISDAFRDAELCASAIHDSMSGERDHDEVMSEYQLKRDRDAMPIYEFTAGIASFEPPTPEQQQLFGAISGNQSAMDDFTKMVANVISPAEFFSEDNVRQIFSEAGGVS